MIRLNNKEVLVRLIVLAIANLLILTAVAFASERGPEELRGKITGVAGDRIHISLSQQQCHGFKP